MSASVPDLLESRRAIRSLLPKLRELRIAVLYGAVSPEDRLYSEACPRAEWSLTLILETMHRLGLNAHHVDPTRDGFVDEIREFDLVFINVHGEYGEDGRLQGLLDYLELPYTGSGVLGSSVGCDKPLTKSAFQLLGVPTPPFVLLGSSSNGLPPRGFDFPLMLKTASGGSSVGTLLIRNHEELAAELATLQRSSSSRLLLETFVEGESVTIGVLDLPTGTAVLPPLQCVTESGYYDRDAKLSGSGATYHVARDFSDELLAALEEATLATYQFLGCRGFARVDFIVTPDLHGLWALEINTIPGLQRMSNIVLAAHAVGLDYDDIILSLLYEALKREMSASWRPERSTAILAAASSAHGSYR